MATIQWVLTEKQAKYINDRHKYLLVEGSAGSSAKLYLQFIKFLFML